MKWFLIGMAAYAAVFAVVVNSVKQPPPPIVALRPAPPAAPMQVTPPKGKPLGIVRLHEVVSGHFVCTGFVIGKTTLFTAAHCIPLEMTLEVRAADGKRTGIIAIAVGGNPRADLAIMRGRLKSFTPLLYTSDPKAILNNIEGSSRKITACGYPYGGSLLCVPVTNRRMYAFHIAGDGYLYPGMSGGPVFDEETKTVIALNSAVNETSILIAPLVEIYAACDVEAEQ
jgi:S1-C subfamily serine protease